MGKRIFSGWTTPDSFLEIENSIFAPHARLGFCNNPEFLGARMVAQGQERRFRPTADAQGFRRTRAALTPAPAGPRVALYGCSFTWGWAVDDERAFAWLLQGQNRDWDVRNYGCGGHGTTQNLLLLREHLASNPPAMVVFNYFNGHLERTVATPELLNRYHRYGGEHDYAGWVHPRAVLSEQGSLAITYVPLVDSHLTQVPAEMVAIDVYYQRLVEKQVFSAAIAGCAEAGCGFVLALMEKLSPFEDELAKHVEAQGGLVCDMRLPLKEARWSCAPMDGHPNETAHAFYAERLQSCLRNSGL